MALTEYALSKIIVT